jgi:hypothetical protein
MNTKQKSLRSFEIKHMIFWLVMVTVISILTYHVNFRKNDEQISFLQKWDVAQKAPEAKFLTDKGYFVGALDNATSLPAVVEMKDGTSIKVTDVLGQQYLFEKSITGKTTLYKHYHGYVNVLN